MNLITKTELESHLWESANILRGTIDSGDYKHYIFPMLGLKRLSDVFNEEVEKLIADGVPEDAARNDPDLHRFAVPAAARWDFLASRTENVGDALNDACQLIEEHNPSLEGVFTVADFEDPRKLGDAKTRDGLLRRLVKHFGAKPLGNKNLEHPDVLGRAYEFLIKKFAETSGKKGGEFFTPPMAVELGVRLLKPEKGMRICDPTCGSGGFLIHAADYVRNAEGLKPGERVDLSVHGQEINGSTWAIAKMNLLLHNQEDMRIERGDTIRNPLLLDENGSLLQYDMVLANPPFSQKDWGHEEAEHDPHGRFHYGIPPRTKGDYAFIQHMIHILNDKGRMATVVPHGVLFRGGAEGKIRQKLLEEDLVDTVIGLGPNIFYGTGIPAAYLILNKNKPPERKGKVLFINASAEYESQKAQNYLRETHLKKIVGAYESYEDVDLFARIVGLDELKDNDWNLNITRYVDTKPPLEPINIEAALVELRELEKKRDEAEAEMNRLLAEMGYA